MILNGEKWHYHALKKIISIINRNTIKNCKGDFYCLNCFHSFKTINKLEFQEKVCENKDFCNIIIHAKETKVFKFNQYQKSGKAPFVIM